MLCTEYRKTKVKYDNCLLKNVRGALDTSCTPCGPLQKLPRHNVTQTICSLKNAHREELFGGISLSLSILE